jgi:RNA polymerase sigma factor (sigma-70 family)
MCQTKDDDLFGAFRIQVVPPLSSVNAPARASLQPSRPAAAPPGGAWWELCHQGVALDRRNLGEGIPIRFATPGAKALVARYRHGRCGWVAVATTNFRVVDDFGQEVYELLHDTFHDQQAWFRGLMERSVAAEWTDQLDEALRPYLNPAFTAACLLAGRELPVYPLHTALREGGCSCGSAGCPDPGRHPRTPRGALDASTDLDTVRAWWQRWPVANLGVLDPDGRGRPPAAEAQFQPGGRVAHVWHPWVEEGIRLEADRIRMAAFLRLVQLFGPLLARVAGRMRLDGEELAQNTTTRALERLDLFEVDRPFRPWLHTVALNTAYDELRHRKRTRDRFVALPPEQAEALADRPPPPPELGLWERAERVLNEDDRLLLRLRYHKGLKLREIARLLRLSVPGVHHRLRRVLEELRASCGDLEL